MPTTLSDAKQRLLDRYKTAGTGSSQGIPRRDPGSVVVQSLNQEQVWTHSQMIGDTPVYNELITIHRRGPLDMEVWERTLDEISRRHEPWRTTFEMGEDDPIQIIHDAAPKVKMKLFDLRSLPAKDRANESRRLASLEAAASFSLKKLPLWRGIVVRMDEEEYQIHMALHHLVLDGVSLSSLLLPECAAIYGAFSEGRPSPLSDPGPQCADYSVWQRRTTTEASLAPHLAYWKQRLADPSAPLSWPNIKPRPAVQSYRGATELVTFPTELVDSMQALATRESSTLFMALAAGFFVLLHRYTGQTDITLGTPAASRTPETNRMMGYFLNLMPVRVDLGGNPSFSEVLTRVRTSYLDALHHGSVPLLRLLREIRPAYDPSRNPLFQIMISMQPPATSPDPAWDLTQSAASSGATKMDMYLNLELCRQGLHAPIAYNPDLLDAADVQRMFADWLAILEGAANDPARAISELPLAPKQQASERGLPNRLRRWFGRK